MNPYFQEVLDAHQLIQKWLGNKEAKEEVCETLLARFSPAYSMVTMGGGLLDYPKVNAFFRTQRGARPGLKIGISDMRIMAASDHGATVVYRETQQLPGESPTLRFSTVVFEAKQNGRVIWRHLQETAIPQS